MEDKRLFYYFIFKYIMRVDMPTYERYIKKLEKEISLSRFFDTLSSTYDSIANEEKEFRTYVSKNRLESNYRSFESFIEEKYSQNGYKKEDIMTLFYASFIDLEDNNSSFFLYNFYAVLEDSKCLGIIKDAFPKYIEERGDTYVIKREEINLFELYPDILGKQKALILRKKELNVLEEQLNFLEAMSSDESSLEVIKNMRELLNLK